MTATLPPSIKFQPLIAGAPLPGGKVYFYAAGTTTPQAVYDADGTTPLANPVILDANGATSFRLGAGLPYKIDVYDANDVHQVGWPEDNVQDLASLAVLTSDLASTATGKGDELVGVKSDLTGGTARTQHDKNADHISVKDFGAVGDGVANDTAPITAAVAAALASKTKAIYFPRGSYLYTPPINIAQDGVEFFGDGIEATYLIPTATAQSGIDIGVTASIEWFAMTGINLVGNATCTNGVRIGSDDGTTYSGVKVYLSGSKIGGFTAGPAVRINRSWWVNIHATALTGCLKGISIPTSARVSTVLVDGWSQIRSHTGTAAIDIRTDNMCDLFVVRDSDISNNYQSALYLGMTTGCGAKILFENVYLEANVRKNNTAAYDPSAGASETYWQFDLLAGGTANNKYAQVTIKDCHSGQPADDPAGGVNHYQIRADYTLLEVSDSQGFADTITTTTNTRSHWVNMGLQNAAGFFASGGQGLGLLGTVTGVDWEGPSAYPGTYNRMEYASKGFLFKGHLGVRQDTKPTIAVGAAAGTGGSVGATVATGSTDTAGQIIVVTGAAALTTGTLATITFNKAYTRAPIVVFSPANGTAATYMTTKQMQVGSTTGNWTLGINVAPGAGETTYWDYIVIE